MSSEIAEPPEALSRGPVPLPKIQIPMRAAALVTRPRLVDDVAAGSGRHVASGGDKALGVTLVCGPAGSGKTTLLVDWARHRRRDPSTAIAWVSLNHDDNDVFILWSAILRALELTGAFPAASPLRGLRAPRHRLDPRFVETFGAAFRQAVRHPIHLVLDDLQEIREPEALASLDTLLRNAPPSLHLLLASRYAPPLGLPRMRLEGRVRDIDRSRLGFTEAEADALLRLHDVELSTSQLALLLSRTEGWAAGLRLAAMSLAKSSEPSQLLAEFAGDDRAVADYLVGEVLERQEAEILDFLLATSVCEQLTAELARHLSGREDAGSLLDELERTNSFITGLGHGYYRYHPMLRQYLRAELSRRGHQTALDLNRAAAKWFEARGETLTALEHAAAAEDDELLAGLLTGHALRHLTSGEGARIRRVLRRVVQSTRRSPAVAAVAALVELDAGNPGAARDLLHPEPAPRFGRPPVVSVATGLVALGYARSTSDARAVRRLLAFPGPMTAEPDLDMLLHLHRGEAALWLGDPAAAAVDLGHAQLLALGEHRPWLTLAASAALASAALQAGELDAAEVAALDALGLAATHGWDASPAAAQARSTLGWIRYHRADDQAAMTLAGAIAGENGRTTPSPDELGSRLLVAFARYAGATDRRAIVQDIRDVWRLRRSGHVQPQLVAVAAFVEQALALAVGEGQWAIEAGSRTRGLLGDTAEVAVMHAVILAHRGRSRTARQMLAPVLRGELPTVSVLTAIEAWLWEARLALRLDDRQRAEVAIAEAVARAAPGSLIRPFQRGGDEVNELLARTAGTFGHQEPFVARVRSIVRPDGHVADGLLTVRELELLSELPSLRTADEIAASMYLSVNTVKTHIRGIYRKLEVNNRRDAVTSARRLGLL
jgi:LuxR family maltose regulon positive regulatory protein